MFLKLSQKNFKKGFTIVETMVSVTIFVVVIIFGMGALLNANVLHNKSQNMRAIIDNLSFIMEDMSRNLRMGSTFHCGSGVVPGVSILSNPQDCTNGTYIAFECSDPIACVKANENDQWVYRFTNRTDGSGHFDIWKSTDGGASWVQLNTNEILIRNISRFSVVGSLSPPGDPLGSQQPIAFVSLVGEIRYKNVVSPFALQTASSQRLMDVIEI